MIREWNTLSRKGRILGTSFHGWRRKIGALKPFVAHVVCGGILIGVETAICFVPGLPIQDPIILMLLYISIVVPISIKCGMIIHPLSNGGLLVITGIQYLVIEWVLFQLSKGSFIGGVGRIDVEGLVIGVLVTLPMLISNYLWLMFIRRQSIT